MRAPIEVYFTNGQNTKVAQALLLATGETQALANVDLSELGIVKVPMAFKAKKSYAGTIRNILTAPGYDDIWVQQGEILNGYTLGSTILTDMGTKRVVGEDFDGWMYIVNVGTKKRFYILVDSISYEWGIDPPVTPPVVDDTSTGRFVYYDSDGKLILDNATGLMWTHYDWKHSVQMYPNQQIAYCDSLSYGGFSDWRLPRIDELITIINYGVANPTVYPEWTNFPSSTGGNKFGSSTIVNTYYYYWTDITQRGRIAATNGVLFPPDPGLVHTMAVRGGPYWEEAGTRLISNTTNTAIDQYSGKIWQKADDGTLRSLADAIAYCSSLSLDGYSNWRLPTVYELFSIVDFTKYATAPMFPNVFTGHAGSYWTGTYLAENSVASYYVKFDSGWALWIPNTVPEYYTLAIHD